MAVDNSNVPGIDLESQEMLHSFVSEAFDSLDTNEPLVDSLKDNDNSECVNAIFRVFHTLKGLSGFFSMMVIHKVTHEAETLLDVIRRQNFPQSEDTLTVIYQTFDFLRAVLQRISVDFTDTSAKDEADDIILILRDCLENVKNQVQQDEANSNKVEPQPVQIQAPIAETTKNIAPEPVKPEPIEEKIDDAEAEIEFNLEPKEEQQLEVQVSEEMLDQYKVGSYELIDLAEKNLLELENNPNNEGLVRETFGAVHSLKGNSGFMGFKEVEDLAAEMETILDSIRNKSLDVDQIIVTVLLSNIEIIRTRLDAMNSSKKGDDTHHQKTSKEEPVHHSAPKAEPVIEPVKVKEVEIKTPIEHPAKEVAEIAQHPLNNDNKPKAESPAALQSMQKKDIRVETIKIDKLFTLVGELITIETMVTKNPDLVGLELPNFNKSANMLNKITRELQEISMSIRMMPLEGLFNKMRRLVRDVSIKMKKKVNLKVSGQDTEMDKNVIDEISDPLVHILRNAIDHGVEIPEDRIKAGKNEEGNVILKAYYEGNEILIIVEDDGAGIYRDKILKKAEEKGILTVPPDSMSDNDVYKLLFEPGFSTAQKVTDISGRGVGMDVVKKNIEKLHGSIDIQTVPGRGSRFTLRIPLTLAIMEAMIIRVGESRYALPILSLRESFRPKPETITVTMDGLEVVRVRQEMLPIVRLHELFHIEAAKTELNQGILIIIEARERKVCLFADEIVGQQQAVIKGLSDYIGKVLGITGCMVLGDGSIGLILDIESLIDMAQINDSELVLA